MTLGHCTVPETAKQYSDLAAVKTVISFLSAQLSWTADTIQCFDQFY